MLTWKNLEGYPAQPGLICSSVCNSVHPSVRAKRGIWVKECLWEQIVIFLSTCVEGILWLFTNFYLQRKFLIFLRNNCDCKVVDPYNHLPQDWFHGGIQRIGWPANRSRFVTKWLKRGHVHNLDLLKKELLNDNPAKKSPNTQKIEFWQAPNA